MSKEFVIKKLELINSLAGLNGWCDGHEYRRLVLIRDAIINLQPPEPPTCDTCKYLDKREYFEYFGNPTKQIAYSCNDNYFQMDNIENPESWGCTSHSDYSKGK